ncbi:MAG: PspC domain-containing protein [Bacteroidales bacterium]|jgi:phage shock protein C|nr:PspC domain-containing protein [Bacteroidales bacterium]
MEPRKLYRSSANKVLGGVCGGLGKYFNIDPVLFRIIFVVLFIGACMGGLAYIIMWIVIPMEPFFTNNINHDQLNN